MYNLPYFKEDDPDVILQFVKDHPFAMLCGTNKNNLPVATQVPVFIDEKDGKLFISGHIMKNTDHHKAFEANPNVLAVFTGPHTYVSATWYDDPHQASTWNYMSVHARGVLKFGTEKELVEILRRLTLHYENQDNKSATVFDNLPSDYTGKLMKAIVSFEIEVRAIENVFKLSQNRNKKSYENIIDQLNKQEGDAKKIATAMEERQCKLFPNE